MYCRSIGDFSCQKEALTLPAIWQFSDWKKIEIFRTKPSRGSSLNSDNEQLTMQVKYHCDCFRGTSWWINVYSIELSFDKELTSYFSIACNPLSSGFILLPMRVWSIYGVCPTCYPFILVTDGHAVYCRVAAKAVGFFYMVLWTFELFRYNYPIISVTPHGPTFFSPIGIKLSPLRLQCWPFPNACACRTYGIIYIRYFLYEMLHVLPACLSHFDVLGDGFPISP